MLIGTGIIGVPKRKAWVSFKHTIIYDCIYINYMPYIQEPSLTVNLNGNVRLMRY